VSILRRFIISDGLRRVLCWFAAWYIRFVRISGLWQVVRGEIPEQFWKSNKPFILSFWHGRLLMMPLCWDTKKKFYMLISQHRDGQIIARIVKHLGIKTTEGSSSKGGAKAFRAILKILAAGEYVGITPDGPRGPRMRATNGVISIAKLSGAPIVPIAFSSTNGRQLNNWDRFLVAWPFSRNVVVWGDPIYIDQKSDAPHQEQQRLHLEAALNAVTNEADSLVGRAPIKAEDEK
jgi:lysophospholipid acyltransferase (LPLAT)-like uncharacterized protein